MGSAKWQNPEASRRTVGGCPAQLASGSCYPRWHHDMQIQHHPCMRTNTRESVGMAFSSAQTDATELRKQCIKPHSAVTYSGGSKGPMSRMMTCSLRLNFFR